MFFSSGYLADRTMCVYWSYHYHKIDKADILSKPNQKRSKLLKNLCEEHCLIDLKTVIARDDITNHCYMTAFTRT